MDFSKLKGKPGLYIVALNNEHLISVNANDPRIGHKSILVNNQNCKFGKATCFQRRYKNYCKTFGDKNVTFIPVLFLNDIKMAEKLVLKQLNVYRIMGHTGRPNEWLQNIKVEQVIQIVLTTLTENNITFEMINKI